MQLRVADRSIRRAVRRPAALALPLRFLPSSDRSYATDVKRTSSIRTGKPIPCSSSQADYWTSITEAARSRDVGQRFVCSAASPGELLRSALSYEHMCWRFPPGHRASVLPAAFRSSRGVRVISTSRLHCVNSRHGSAVIQRLGRFDHVTQTWRFGSTITAGGRESCARFTLHGVIQGSFARTFLAAFQAPSAGRDRVGPANQLRKERRTEGSTRLLSNGGQSPGAIEPILYPILG